MAVEEIVGGEKAAEAAVAEFWDGKDVDPAELKNEDAPARLAANDARQQKDELEEEGLTNPDNPDGTLDEKETVADDEVQEEEVAGDEPAAPVKTALDGFDPNLVAVAKELGGWRQEDIEKFVAESPTLARMTFSKILDSHNALSLQYAQASRSAPPAQTQVPQTGATVTKSFLDELASDPAKLAQFAEIAGKEVVDQFVKPMLEERKAALEDKAFIAEIRAERTLEQITGTFSDLAGKGFKDFYGTDPVDLSPEQYSNRQKVGLIADFIRGGAEARGVQMSVKDAIKRAHLIVASEQTAATARKAVVADVRKRSKVLTTRATHRNTPSSSSKGDAAALEAVATFWDEKG